jgi:hypothetical protein
MAEHINYSTVLLFPQAILPENILGSFEHIGAAPSYVHKTQLRLCRKIAVRDHMAVGESSLQIYLLDWAYHVLSEQERNHSFYPYLTITEQTIEEKVKGIQRYARWGHWWNLERLQQQYDEFANTFILMKVYLHIEMIVEMVLYYNVFEKLRKALWSGILQYISLALIQEQCCHTKIFGH